MIMKTSIIIIVIASLSIGGFAQKNASNKVLAVFDLDDESTESQENCICVPYYQCTPNNLINTNGITLINLKENKGCDNYMEICCNPRTIQARTPTTDPPDIGCGYRNPDGYGFRITGNPADEAQFGEFPWMIAILEEGSGSAKAEYKCGGTLINPQAVLTAAHCVTSPGKKYIVRAGEWDTQRTSELYPHQERYVKTIEIHKDHFGGAAHNDIAFLFLEKPLTYTKTVNTICLPKQDEVMPNGTRCYASGWGKDAFGKKGKKQVILKKINLPMVDHDICERRLKDTRLGMFYILDDSFVCAGGEGADTCTGDGGSPLACPIPGRSERYQHIGITSWGLGCGEIGIPGAYANVAMFRNWIDANMRKYKLETSTYQY